MPSVHRPVAIFLTIDETLPSVPAVGCAAFSVSSRLSRRSLANVFRRFVSKLGVYRNEGSRIDLMYPHIGVSSSHRNGVTRLSFHTLIACFAAVRAPAHRDVWLGELRGAMVRPCKCCPRVSGIRAFVREAYRAHYHNGAYYH